ncbi:MAG TPA: hypothetical protein VHM01_07320 [Alphaproteobacteria bacterium]|nr:hypothetical protein [Alphaproteobacteria bacterium]
MTCPDHNDERPLGASASPPREPDCRFRTIKHYFDGPVIARCLACERLVGIDEIGDNYITMPCGETWAINLRSILQGRS